MNDSEKWQKVTVPPVTTEEWVQTINQVYSRTPHEAEIQTEWWTERLANGHGRPMSADEFGMHSCRLSGLFVGVRLEATTTGTQPVVALVNPMRENVNGENEPIVSGPVVTIAVDQLLGDINLRKYDRTD